MNFAERVNDQVVEAGLRAWEGTQPKPEEAKTVVIVEPTGCEGGKHTVRPGTNRCYCGVFTYRQVKLYHGQGRRERIRRLKQITRQQLTGGVTPEAAAVGRRVGYALAVLAAERACYDYASETFYGDYAPERHEARQALHEAVAAHARWVRGESDDQTASISACVESAPAGVAQRDADHDLPAQQD